MYEEGEHDVGTTPWSLGPIFNDTVYDGTYTGDLKNGIPDGRGTWRDPSGRKYCGFWKSGMLHGTGTLGYEAENSGNLQGIWGSL